MTHHPDTGLPQRVALGVLLRSFPPAQVDRVLDAAGRREQRQRLLPARLMVYFTLGMWIFKALPYEQILAEILRGAPGLAVAAATDETASAAAIGRARRRLGVEPLKFLFEQAAGPSMPPAVASFRGLRPIRMRRAEVSVPATPANLLVFGAPMPLGTAASALPPTAARTARTPLRAPLGLLIEERTGRVAAADVADGADVGAVDDRLLAGVAAEGSILIMDERPLSARIWTTIERFGAEQLWPIADSAQPSSATRLPDGSLLGKLPDDDGSELVVRIIPRGYRANRLATSILDHRVASAAELAALYAPRSAGPVFGGLGHGADDTLELRSKDPEMCRQELYAMLCVQHAIGDLIEPIQGIAENGRGRFDAF